MSDFETFQHLIVEWLANSKLFPGRNLHIDLIINPSAGAFTHRRRCRALLEDLRNARLKHPLTAGTSRSVATFITEYAGHEKTILGHLQTTDPLPEGSLRLIVVAGGDGTSRGVLISALDLPENLRANLVFFRLPLGTGNDGAETRDWAEALDVLAGSGAQASVQPLRVVEVRIPGQSVHYSFNIASVGLDAFVADMTNQFKTWLPGNSYSLMVDIAAFFYEGFVQQAPTRLELTDHGKSVLTLNETFLLAALGVSGHRTYGAGKKVLPDEANFCLATVKSIFTKLKYKKPFYEGSHRGLDRITLASGDRLEIQSPVQIPLQMDGEVLWLNPADLPVVMQIADRGLHALKPSPKLE